jgi:hypothetical protein
MNLKKVFKTLLAAALVFIVVLVVLWQFLPVFIETNILPGLAEENGIGWQEGRIRRIGLTAFEAGPVAIGRDNSAGITVDTVRADYTPLGLFRKRIATITVSGLRLNMAVKDGKMVIHGIDMNRPVQQPTEKAPAHDAAESTVAIHRIRITHGVFNLDLQNTLLSIPFDLSARLAPTGEIDSILTLSPCGQKVQVAGHWSQKDSSGTVSLTVRSLDLEKMAAMLKAMPGWVVRGDMDVKAEAAIRRSPFAFTDLLLSVGSASMRATFGDLGLTAAPVAGNTKHPLLINVNQTAPGRFALKAGGLVVQGKVPLALDSLKGELFYDSQAVNARLKVKSRLPVFAEGPEVPVGLKEDLELASDISAYYAFDGDWRLDVDDVPGGGDLVMSAGLGTGEVQVVAVKPVYSVHLEGRSASALGTFSASSAGIRADAPSGTVNALKLAVQADMKADLSGETMLSEGSARVQISGILAELVQADPAQPVSIAIPHIQARAEMEAHDGSILESKGPLFKGDLQIAASTLDAPAKQIRLEGIQVRVPWQWPGRKDAASGQVAVSSIKWQNQEVGSLGITVRQQSDGIGFQGEHINNLLPALELGFSGDVTFPPDQGMTAEVTASMARSASAPEIDLGRLSKKGRDIYISGTLSGDFNGVYTNRGMGGVACVRLEQADIRIPEKDLAVKSLSVGLCFPDLPELTTGPSQTLTFDIATAGNFKIEDGLFHFQLEPHQTLFVEKGHVGWCGGKIRLQPMRITPGIDEYETRLDCDRLNLARILEQLSVADAVGEGTVNGTLPISIKAGRIWFDDGFLYSTPGDGGKIRLSGADALMAGIPRGTRQFFQIDLAREALKDFEYKWTKLRVASEVENLRMRLQFDGKPSRILPFEYDKEIGGFVRVDADSRGSDFQGISLDVNFTVPLNDLLEYKDVLNLLE